jgi:hydroxylamine reductase (hybrid-cluster protein)
MILKGLIMKLSLLFFVVVLAGCASKPDTQMYYYETSKSLSRDNALLQTACLAAITEIAKSGDNTTKLGALNSIDECNKNLIRIESPKQKRFGF